jgi:hypothetical protein
MKFSRGVPIGHRQQNCIQHTSRMINCKCLKVGDTIEKDNSSYHSIQYKSGLSTLKVLIITGETLST